MALTVNAAFTEFLKDFVNLDTSETGVARRSRDYLIEQINSLPSKSNEFPTLVPENHIHYGSFARRTKTRSLDDIDIMICLHAYGATHHVHSNDRVILYANSSNKTLNSLSNDGSTINSIKVINRFVSHLSKIHQYRNADLNRRQEAAVLNLSYSWSFDIVPCFKSATGDYFIMPDGKGEWKKTDPRIDKAKAERVNSAHGGNVLNVIRAIKYWNKRRIVATIPSYLLENIILNYYDSKTSRASLYVDEEISFVLDYLANAVYYQVEDPKRIQGNLNKLTTVERININQVATQYAQIAREARAYEAAANQRSCVSRWRDFFGPNFPQYG